MEKIRESITEKVFIEILVCSPLKKYKRTKLPSPILMKFGMKQERVFRGIFSKLIQKIRIFARSEQEKIYRNSEETPPVPDLHILGTERKRLKCFLSFQANSHT